MKLSVSHRTFYRYTSPVVQSQHLIHLSPRSTERQIIRHHSLLIEPAPASRYDGVDAFGNHMAVLDIEMPHKEFVLHARSTVETIAPPDTDFSASSAWDRLDDTLGRNGAIPLDVVPFRCASRLTTASLDIADYAALSFTPGRPVLEGAMDLTDADLSRVHLRSKGDRRLDADPRGVPPSPRRMPGLRSFRPRLPARAAHPGALRQRLHSDQAGSGPAAAAGRGRFARVDFGMGAGNRLGRSRSYQRHRRSPTST